jgi:Domain of unknown function (DUF4132)
MRVSKNIEEQINQYHQEIQNGHGYYFYDTALKDNFLLLIEKYARKIINFETFDNSLFIDINNSHYWLQQYFRTVLGFKDIESNKIWFIEHPIGKVIFSKSSIPQYLEEFSRHAILSLLSNFNEKEIEVFIPYLNKNGFDNSYIIKNIALLGFDFYNYKVENNIVAGKTLNGIGLFLLSSSKNSLFSIFKKSESNNIDEFIKLASQNPHSYNTYNTFVFLNENAPAQLFEYKHHFFVYKDENGFTNLDLRICSYIIHENFDTYKGVLEQLLKNDVIRISQKYQLASLLNDKLNNNLKNECLHLGREYLEFKIANPIKSNYFYSYYDESFETIGDKIILIDIFEKLINENKSEAYNTLNDYSIDIKSLQIPFLQFVVKTFDKDALPVLIIALDKNKIIGDERFYTSLFELIKTFDFANYKNDIFDFIERITNKKIRVIASAALASLDENIIPDAKELLFGKTVAQRTIGALILSRINNTEIKQLLTEVVNTEKNDDTRDIIIENLQEQLYSKAFTIEDCKTLIAFATARGKLSKLNEKFIDETALPNLNWNDGSALSTEEKRFLLYRMARSKGLNSDIEARKVIQLIDKNTSGAFSKFLLKCFADSESNTKYKYYISLAAMLGGNESIAQLNTTFRNAITDKRVKLAEMIVSALAMVGTNKALLSVESISRKFANKKPAISAAANAALEAAAEELNITKDELGDRIIPTFDFDGIFKEFTIEEDTYRAFVDKDFTLCFYDDNNKMRKSFPKNITKELKTEFTEINKEIKNVVKSQHGRLESFLMENRKWTVEDWQTYFLNHPIMIVYATHLLWIVYGANGKIKDTILCQEDGSIVNYNEEEVTLEDTDSIGLYHPIHLTEMENTNWNTKLYDKNFVPIFPQTNRKIFTPLEEELEKNVSERFNNQEIPKGADYTKSFMEKSGWLKSSGDGGSAEFSKKFNSIGLTITPYIDGPTSWYQEGNAKATMHQIYFQGANYSEKFLIKDVPPVIYSEIIASFETLIATV